MSPFRLVDHTADIAVEIWGKDEHDFFNETIRALFFLLTDQKLENMHFSKSPRRKRLKLDFSSFDEGYIDFINRIIGFVDMYAILAVGANVIMRNKKAFITVNFLEGYSSHIKREIKAATRHNFRVVRNDNGIKTRITFDI
ncbi:MAG: archease [Spirochaetota bacterium]|nr:MAG: archease [Spirochaetota bacterium]